MATKPSTKGKTTATRTTKSKKPVKKTASAPKSSAKMTAFGLEHLGIKPYTPKKNENYMSKSMLEHFNLILEAWKRNLMEEVDRTVHHMQDDAKLFPDPLDRAVIEEEFNLELRTRDRERKLIRKIDDSLENIKSGEYGYCNECDAEIGLRRLEARPTAEQCIDCKTFDEIREKQTTG